MNITAKDRALAASIRHQYQIGYSTGGCLRTKGNGPMGSEYIFKRGPYESTRKRLIALGLLPESFDPRRNGSTDKVKKRKSVSEKNYKSKSKRSRKKKQKIKRKAKRIPVPSEVSQHMDTIIDELHRQVGCTDDDPTFVIYRNGQIRQAMGHLVNRVPRAKALSLEHGRQPLWETIGSVRRDFSAVLPSDYQY